MTVETIDYSSRDYATIRSDLLTAAEAKLPQWTSRSPNDFGVVLVELFAHMGDVLHYYLDRIANEAFLGTAAQRSTVLEIAALLDYRPAGNAAASVRLLLTNSTSSPTLLGKGTQVATNTATYTDRLTRVDRERPRIVFETDADVLIAANATALVTATEGSTITAEDEGTSSGAADQAVTLKRVPVIDGSVRVEVDEGNGPVPWTYLEHLIDADIDDAAYTLKVNADQGVTVLFGDAVNGRIPAQGAVVLVTYRVGGGADGNVGPTTIVRVLDGPGGIAVTNPAAAFGGSDAETMASIRKNAPRALFALNRAVSLLDYEFLALRVPQVAKAKARSSVYSSVVVHIAPAGGGGLDALGVPTAAFVTLKAAVANFLSDKCPAPTTVTIADPVYVPIYITVSVHVADRYLQDRVAAATLAALATLLDFENSVFGDRVTVSDIYSVLSAVPGVDYCSVQVLSRTTTGAADVVLADNEIPAAYIAGSSTITVTPSGGIVE